MDDNKIKNGKLNILAAMSNTLNSYLHADKYGRCLEHLCGRVDWLPMDKRTCALIFDFDPEIDISFKLKEHFPDSCFHALFLLKGNAVFSGFSKKGSINIMQREFLYFHTDRHDLEVCINKGSSCQLVFITHGVGASRMTDNAFATKSDLQLGLCEGESSKFLTDIFKKEGRVSPFFQLKGLLFMLMGSTLPDSYRNTQQHIKKDHSKVRADKPSAQFERRNRLFKKGERISSA